MLLYYWKTVHLWQIHVPAETKMIYCKYISSTGSYTTLYGAQKEYIFLQYKQYSWLSRFYPLSATGIDNDFLHRYIIFMYLGSTAVGPSAHFSSDQFNRWEQNGTYTEYNFNGKELVKWAAGTMIKLLQK